jgi:hypothetical protein
MDDIQVTQPSWRCPPCVNTSQQAGQRVNPTVPHLLLLPYNRNFTATGHQPCNPPTAMHVNLLPACRFPAQGGLLSTHTNTVASLAHHACNPLSQCTRGDQHNIQTVTNHACCSRHQAPSTCGSAGAPTGQHKYNALLLPAASKMLLPPAS